MTASCVTPAYAGVFTNSFNADPGAAVTLTGNATWVASGGVGGGGYISITDAVNSQQGVLVIPEIDPGQAIGGFRADFKIQIGGGSARPADGVAFVFAPEVDDSSNFGEEGLGTGLVLSFDTWDNNGSDTAPAIDVKVGGTADGNIVSTTYLGGQREGNRARPAPIFKDAAGNEVQLTTDGQFVPVTVEVKNGLLNVFYKGNQLVKDVTVPFAPVPGRFAFGGRTGNANANHWIDDLRIETFARTAPSISGVRPSPSGFTIQIQDAPGGAITASSVSVTLDGATVNAPATKAGDVTTISYNTPNLFAPGSTHTAVVKYKYGATGVDATNTVTLNIGNYTVLPASAKLPAGAIDTTKRGFTWRVHQVEPDPPGELPNSTLRTERQLAGELGANVADPAAVGGADAAAAAPSPATAPLNFTVSGVINFSQAADENNGNAVPDLQMPGIPGTGGGTDNIAGEIITALEFPTAGSYTLIVNSDDGFRAWSGRNPRDVTSPVLGFFEGGRGAADSPFQVYVSEAGIYPIRIIWQEGGGGANIEFLSQLADGTKVLINDPANPQAVKAYQLPTSGLPAYVRSVSPAPGSSLLVRPKTIDITLTDAGTQINANNITLKLNGANAAVTATKTGADTKVVHTVVGDLQPSTEYTAELTYSDNSGPRTVSWKFTTGALSSTLFVIEAEDFDYEGGKANPKRGQSGQDVNVMPYLGGAYLDLGAIEGVDFVNADGPDSDVYRQETGDDGDHEVNIAVANNANPGNGSGGSIPIGSNDRGTYTSTSNYRIGWVGANEWQNYTRTFPNNGAGGWWKVYAALSYDGNAAGQLAGSLSRVTAGWGTSEQTAEVLGTFAAPGSGGWGANNLVAMKTASGADAVVKLNGTNTVRFNLSSGDFDFLIFSAAAPPPPFVSAAPIDSVKRSEVVLDWTLTDTDVKINASSIKVFIDDQDVTSKATSAKTATGATVHLDMTGTAVPAGERNWRLTFTDDSSPAQNVTATGKFLVNPLPTPGTFVIEAEDFNYSENGVGGKSNPQKGTPGMDVDVMPYDGAAYAGLSAIEGVDYNNGDGNDSDVYRTELDENGENEVNIATDNGNRFSQDRGTFQLTSNYRIGWVGAGEWQNYTRTFPAGDYNVWAALSFDGRAAGQLSGSLDLVTSNPAQPNQQVQRLGSFSAPGSGGWGRNELVPMKDNSGNMAVVKLGGVQTVRFNLGSGDFDFLMFTPATGGPVDPGTGPRITSVKRNANGSLTIEWTGGGSLQSAPSVTGPWTDVPNATSPFTFTPTGNALFGRIKR